jgi:hypothetical protein
LSLSTTRLARLLPLLGFVFAATALWHLEPWLFEGDPSPVSLGIVPFLLFNAGVGLAIVVLSWQCPTPRRAAFLLPALLLTYPSSHRLNVTLRDFFAIVELLQGWSLLTGAAAILGSALARCERPTDPKVRRFGRLSGGLAFFSVGVQLYLHAMEFQSNPWQVEFTPSVRELLLLVLTGGLNSLLLYAAYLSVSPDPAEDPIPRRQARIVALMIIWFVTVVLSSLVTFGLLLLQHEDIVWPMERLLLRTLLENVTYFMMVALLAARCNAGYKSDATLNSSPGAET